MVNEYHTEETRQATKTIQGMANGKAMIQQTRVGVLKKRIIEKVNYHVKQKEVKLDQYVGGMGMVGVTGEIIKRFSKPRLASAPTLPCP